MSFKQWEAETGGQQLLYHGRTCGADGLARDLLDKHHLLSEEKICTQRWVRILPVMGRASLEGSGAL